MWAVGNAALGLIISGMILGFVLDWLDEREEFAARIAHWFSDPTDPWTHDQENCDRCSKPSSGSSSAPSSSVRSPTPKIAVSYIGDGMFTSRAIDGRTFHRGFIIGIDRLIEIEEVGASGADEQRSRPERPGEAGKAQ